MPASSANKELSLYDMEPLIREVLDSGSEFELSPRGSSMLPLIKGGRDTVTLVKPKGRLSLDDIALYKRENGQFVLHRVVNVLDGCYDMCGDNQSSPECEVKDSQIIALVSKLTLNGKTYSSNDKKLRRYANRRRNLKLRRIILAIKSQFKINKK